MDIKAFLWKWISTGGSREFAIPAAALLFIMTVDMSDMKCLAVSIIAVAAVLGVLGKKWMEKPAVPAPTVGTSADITITGGGDGAP